MKIISAKCEFDAANRAYSATICVMSDSRTHQGEGLATNPDQAAHSALSEACNKFREELHNSLSVGVQVNF